MSDTHKARPDIGKIAARETHFWARRIPIGVNYVYVRCDAAHSN